MPSTQYLIQIQTSHLLIGLFFILAIIAVIAFVKIREFVKMVRLDEMVDAYQEYKKIPESPKSLSGMDSIYAPMIEEDFPNLNINQLKKRAENALTNVFDAIEEQNPEKLEAVSELVYAKVNNIINDQKRLGQKEYFDSTKFHNTVLSQYQRNSGYLSIIFQTGVEFFHYIKQNDDIINGSKTKKQQERFEVSFAYVQDLNKIDDQALKTGVYGLNCPNCAAPITTLGQKYCTFCGTAVEDVNVNSWIIIDFARK